MGDEKSQQQQLEHDVPSSGKALSAEVDQSVPKLDFLHRLMNIEDSTDDLELIVGSLLYQGSIFSVALWVALLLVAYVVAPEDSYRELNGMERSSELIVLVLLVVSTASQILRPIIRDQNFKGLKSGVMAGMAVVQLVAVASNAIMIYNPTPIMIDPVTGAGSYLVRWAEWGSLGFLMTFLTEGMALPLEGGSSTFAWMHAGAISCCILGGAAMPFCTTWTAWLTVFGMSWTIFCTLFFRIFKRGRRLWQMSPGTTSESQEEYDRALYSYKIVTVCTGIWTALAISYSVAVLVVPNYAAPGSVFGSPFLVLIIENIFEVLSKIFYAATLVEAHNKVFDPVLRKARRLEELRKFMSAVWDTSTDVIVMCTQTEKHINGILSPAFSDGRGKLDVDSLHGKLGLQNDKVTTVMEVDVNSEAYASFQIDLRSPIAREDAFGVLWKKRKQLGRDASIHEKNIAVMADLLRQVCRSKEKEATIMKDFHQKTSSPSILRCEAKITRVENGAFLVVIRDISERFKIFETEKSLIKETTARKMAAEANRFTRHEVKNGILAAIGLLDSLRDAPRNLNVADGDSGGASGFYDCLGELDNTLRDILDTVVDHAMSREVIYEEYDVRKERIHVPGVLTSVRSHTNSYDQARFPMHQEQNPFPTLSLDPRLLRCIYQSAMTNACVYGKANGDVKTNISYDEDKKRFRLEVINLPGENHKKLLAMDYDEVQARVFAPGTTLVTQCDEDSFPISGNSGDGGWIMQKCAKTLKGKCELLFEKDRTVFSFVCPARAYAIDNESELLTANDLTKLPENCWGVVIDDSGIQRKLMDRFLKLAGIEEERRIIVGKDAQEIYGFCERVVNLVESQPKDKFLVIADENLEVMEGVALIGTVSGSKCIQKILQSLKPSDVKRVLALVRSANDSAKDIETYEERAHGYIVKAPIDKNGVLNALKPMWFRRFPQPQRSTSSSALKRSDSSGSFESTGYNPFHDINEGVEVVDALFKGCDQSSLQKRWRSIQDRLRILRKDIMEAGPDGDDEKNDNKIDLVSTLRALDELLSGDEIPEDAKSQWDELRMGIECFTFQSQR